MGSRIKNNQVVPRLKGFKYLMTVALSIFPLWFYLNDFQYTLLGFKTLDLTFNKRSNVHVQKAKKN